MSNFWLLNLESWDSDLDFSILDLFRYCSQHYHSYAQWSTARQPNTQSLCGDNGHFAANC